LFSLSGVGGSSGFVAVLGGCAVRRLLLLFGWVRLFRFLCRCGAGWAALLWVVVLGAGLGLRPSWLGSSVLLGAPCSLFGFVRSCALLFARCSPLEVGAGYFSV